MNTVGLCIHRFLSGLFTLLPICNFQILSLSRACFVGRVRFIPVIISMSYVNLGQQLGGAIASAGSAGTINLFDNIYSFPAILAGSIVWLTLLLWFRSLVKPTSEVNLAAKRHSANVLRSSLTLGTKHFLSNLTKSMIASDAFATGFCNAVWWTGISLLVVDKLDRALSLPEFGWTLGAGGSVATLMVILCERTLTQVSNLNIIIIMSMVQVIATGSLALEGIYGLGANGMGSLLMIAALQGIATFAFNIAVCGRGLAVFDMGQLLLVDDIPKWMGIFGMFMMVGMAAGSASVVALYDQGFWWPPLLGCIFMLLGMPMKIVVILSHKMSRGEDALGQKGIRKHVHEFLEVHAMHH